MLLEVNMLNGQMKNSSKMISECEVMRLYNFADKDIRRLKDKSLVESILIDGEIFYYESQLTGSVLNFPKLTSNQVIIFNNDKKFVSRYLKLSYWLDIGVELNEAIYRTKFIRQYKEYFDINYEKLIKADYNPETIEETCERIRTELLTFKYNKISDIEGYSFSQRAVKYWLFKGHSLEDSKAKSSEIQRNNGLKWAQMRRDNPELYIGLYPTSIEYWLKRGYSEEESRRLLSEHQSTFSLKICIGKYGEVEGTRVFNERQEKWQNTINSKPQEEKDDMNRRKSSGINRFHDRNMPGKLYYIRFYNHEIEFWKIGITVKEVIGERFENEELFKQKYNLEYEILNIKEFDTIQQAYDIEQGILRKFNNLRVTIDYNNFRTTEAFDKNILNKFKGFK